MALILKKTYEYWYAIKQGNQTKCLIDMTVMWNFLTPFTKHAQNSRENFTYHFSYFRD